MIQRLLRLLTLLMLTASALSAESNWWDAKWTIRKKIDIDTTGKGLAIAEPIGTTAVLLRLHEGVFSFISSKEDGSDLRFVADDHKTVLKHHIEKWDALLNEAYVWVQVPDLKPASATSLWLYYGNSEAGAPEAAKESYEANTTLVYHFADASKAGTDSSPTGAKAEGAPPAAAGVWPVCDQSPLPSPARMGTCRAADCFRLDQAKRPAAQRRDLQPP